MSVKRFCDWCGNEIDDYYLMPRGEAVTYTAERRGHKFQVAVAWVALDDTANMADLHRSCVRMVMQQSQDDLPEPAAAKEDLPE